MKTLWQQTAVKEQLSRSETPKKLVPVLSDDNLEAPGKATFAITGHVRPQNTSRSKYSEQTLKSSNGFVGSYKTTNRQLDATANVGGKEHFCKLQHL